MKKKTDQERDEVPAMRLWRGVKGGEKKNFAGKKKLKIGTEKKIRMNAECDKIGSPVVLPSL